MLKNVSSELIQNMKDLRISLNELTICDLDTYTVIELYYKVANKLNEVIRELSRFEGVLSDEVVKQNEKLIYLLNTGLQNEVIREIDNLINRGFFEELINIKLFNDLKLEITKDLKTITHLNKKHNVGEPKKALYSQANKINIDFRNLNDFDECSGTAQLKKGKFSSNSNEIASARRYIGKGVNLSLQAKFKWDNTQLGSWVSFSTTGLNDWKFGFVKNKGFVIWNGMDNIIMTTSQLFANSYILNVICVGRKIIVTVHAEGSSGCNMFEYSREFRDDEYSICLESCSTNDVIEDLKIISTHITDEQFLPPIIPNTKSHYVGSRHVTGSGMNSICFFPSNYNPTKKTPCLMYFHGSGGHDIDIVINSNESRILTPFLNDGYVVIACDYNSRWGNDENMDNIRECINYFKERVNIGDIYVIGQSMGATVSINAIARDILKPVAYWGIYPCVNLTKAFENNTLKNEIKVSYNINSDEEFLDKTRGRDIIRDYDLTFMRKVPTILTHSYQDTIVPREFNTDILKEKLTYIGCDVKVLNSYGEHGDASNFSDDVIKSVLEFFNS